MGKPRASLLPKGTPKTATISFIECLSMEGAWGLPETYPQLKCDTEETMVSTVRTRTLHRWPTDRGHLKLQRFFSRRKGLKRCPGLPGAGVDTAGRCAPKISDFDGQWVERLQDTETVCRRHLGERFWEHCCWQVKFWSPLKKPGGFTCPSAGLHMKLSKVHSQLYKDPG